MAKRHGIVRIRKKTSNYAMIDKRYLSDPLLSWKAKGLLTYLLSKQDDWKVILTDLVRQSTDGEASVRQGLKELGAGGYLLRVRRADRKSGRFIAWEMTIFETPELAAEARLAEPNLFETTTADHRVTAHDSQIKPPNPRFSQNTPDGDFPHVADPHVGLPVVDSPHVENRRLLINDGTRTDWNNDSGGNAPSPCPSPTSSPAMESDPPPFEAGAGKPFAVPASVLDDPVMLLVTCEFQPADARNLVAKFGEQQVKIAVANADILAGQQKLKDRRRYIAAAIRGRYQPITSAPAKLKSSADLIERQRRENLLREQAERDQLEAQRREEDAILARLSEPEWQAHVATILPQLTPKARTDLAAGVHPRDQKLVRIIIVTKIQREMKRGL